jgi:hypothetical protein
MTACSPVRTRTARQQRTQWAAQFLAASELVRRGYVVSFTMGNHTPTADLMVGVPESGLQFWVDVKGLSSNNAWLVKQKPDHLNLFYILVRVGDDRGSDRFFILDQAQLNALLERSRLAHPNDPTSGFGWSYPAPFEDRWDTLPKPGYV